MRRFQMRREPASGVRQSGAVAGGKDKELRGAFLRCGRGGGRNDGGFLEDHMDIGAADAGGIDTRDAWPLAARPRFELRIDVKRALFDAEFRIGAFEIDRAGGRLSCSSESMVLIKPVTPAATSRWPTLAFTEPSRQGCGRAADRRSQPRTP